MFVAWMDYIMLLLQGSSVVITTALVLFGIPTLRRQLLLQNRSITINLLIILLFSLFAIYGTHAGKVVSLNDGLKSVTLSHELKQNEAVVNFRDMVVVTAGLAAGPWIGMLVGSIAGLERYSLSGFTALSCAIASILSGLLAGLFRQRLKALVKPYQAAIIATVTVLLQMILILLLAKPFLDARLLVQQIGIPMIVTAAVGCYAFQQVLRGLDKVRLQMESRKIKIRAQRAEIRALHAQIEPHFLMNVLNAINALIRIDQDKARHYISLLGEFLHETRHYAARNSIQIQEELSHVQKYLDFQTLRFSNSINYQVHIESPKLLKYQIPPRSLLTLVENTLEHGFNSDTKENSITVSVEESEGNLIISVEDDGIGMSTQKIQAIGNKPVFSKHKKGGHGLYHLNKTLKTMYGEASNFEIKCLPDQKGTIVQLTLPIKNYLGDYSS